MHKTKSKLKKELGVLKLKEIFIVLRSSFWFIPIILVCIGIILAFGLIEIDTFYATYFSRKWPRIFSTGIDASRGMLTTIAGSIISMMAVTFSMTLVTLALASSQYTSRILRTLMRSQLTQILLGIFAGIFSYCLIVLKSIDGGVDGGFVPSLAILTGLILAIFAVGMLVFYIHHIASSIQASNIISSISSETIKSIENKFPLLNSEVKEDPPLIQNSQFPFSVLTDKSGHIQFIGKKQLMDLANEWDVMMKINYGVGEFVVEGTALVLITKDINVNPEMIEKLRDNFTIRPFRTIEDDPLFGIRQIVDIALKALSPGINDTTTAVTCIHYLTAIMASLNLRRMPSYFHYAHSQLRIISKEESYEDFLGESFHQIRSNAQGNVTILGTLLSSIQTLTSLTTIPLRRHYLAQEVIEISEVLEATINFPHEKVELKKMFNHATDYYS